MWWWMARGWKKRYLNGGFVYIFAVVIDSGPRYEVAYPSGVSHFLEKLAFNVSWFGIFRRQ